ncbi:MAG: phosphoribosyltransferase family protein [bacterium]|nr:phosphoribosyltransferase family protein [bacterium]
MGFGGVLQRALQLLLPEPCAGCGRLGTSVCQTCIDELSFVPRLIPTPSKCESITYYADYTGIIKQLISVGKFDGSRTVLEQVGKKLAIAVNHLHLECDLIMPIPIHKKRQKSRGFNQVEVLFKRSLDNEGLRFESGLTRQRNTTPLYELNPQERAKVMEGNITVDVSKVVSGKRVLLLYDIYTSGTTLNAAANALKSAGASQVTAHVLCYSKPHEKRRDHFHSITTDSPRSNQTIK